MPKVQTFYNHHFNNVDRFNKMSQSIAFPTRFHDIDFRVLIGYIEIAIVQTTSLYYDWKNEVKPDMHVRDVAQEIARGLDKEAKEQKKMIVN